MDKELLPFVTDETERNFEVTMPDGNKVKLKINRATQNQLLDIDKVYRIAYSKLLRSGCLTNAEVEKYVEKNEIWMDEDDEKVAKLQKEMISLEQQLADKNYKMEEEGYLKAIKLSELRDKIYQMSRKIGSIYDNTCENASDELRMQHLCVNTTLKQDNIPFFKDFDDFSTRANEDATAEALRQCILFNSRLKENFMMDLPENQWMQDNGFMDDKGTLIKKEKAEEKVPEKAEEKPKKSKKTRKAKSDK